MRGESGALQEKGLTAEKRQIKFFYALCLYVLVVEIKIVENQEG
jgi:hypothetical protein